MYVLTAYDKPQEACSVEVTKQFHLKKPLKKPTK